MKTIGSYELVSIHCFSRLNNHRHGKRRVTLSHSCRSSFSYTKIATRLATRRKTEWEQTQGTIFRLSPKSLLDQTRWARHEDRVITYLPAYLIKATVKWVMVTICRMLEPRRWLPNVLPNSDMSGTPYYIVIWIACLFMSTASNYSQSKGIKV